MAIQTGNIVLNNLSNNVTVTVIGKEAASGYNVAFSIINGKRTYTARSLYVYDGDTTAAPILFSKTSDFVQDATFTFSVKSSSNKILLEANGGVIGFVDFTGQGATFNTLSYKELLITLTQDTTISGKINWDD